MIAPPPSISPDQQRRLSRLFSRLRARGQQDAEAISLQGTQSLIGSLGSMIGSLAGDVSGAISATVVGALQGHPVSTVAPTVGQALVWDGSVWKGGAPGDSSGVILDYSTLVNEALAGSGATASASSFYPGVVPVSSPQPPSYLIDNLELTFWQSNWGVSGGPFTGVNGQWARVDLGSPKAITYVRVGMILSNGPPTWKLQSSTDDSTWTDRFLGTGDDDTGIVGLSGSPITARYWRVLATSENSHAPSPTVSWLIRTLAIYSGTPLRGATGHAIQDEGSNLSQRTRLNFVGAGVTATDDSPDDATVVTIPGGAGHTIEDEGTPLTTRANLNFVGAGVTVSDDSGNDASVVTIPAGAPLDATYVTRTSNGTLTAEVLLAQVYAHELKTRWELISNGDAVFPEILFMDSDPLYMEVIQ